MLTVEQINIAYAIVNTVWSASNCCLIYSFLSCLQYPYVLASLPINVTNASCLWIELLVLLLIPPFKALFSSNGLLNVQECLQDRFASLSQNMEEIWLTSWYREYPIIYRVFYTSKRWCSWGFLNRQQLRMTFWKVKNNGCPWSINQCCCLSTVLSYLCI